MRAEERRLWRALGAVSDGARVRAGSRPTRVATFLALPASARRARARPRLARSRGSRPPLLWLGARAASRRARRSRVGFARRPRSRTRAVLHWIYVVTVTLRPRAGRRSASSRRSRSPPTSRPSRRSSAARAAWLGRARRRPRPSRSRRSGPRSTTCAPSRSRAFPGRRSATRSTQNRGAAAARALRRASTGSPSSTALGGASPRRACAAPAPAAPRRGRRSPLAAAGCTALGAGLLAAERGAAGRRAAPRRRAPGQHRPGREVVAGVGRADARDLRGADPRRGGAQGARDRRVAGDRGARLASTSTGAARAPRGASRARRGAALVVGAVGLDGYDPGAERCAAGRYFDSAFVFDPRRRRPRPLRQDPPRALRRVRAASARCSAASSRRRRDGHRERGRDARARRPRALGARRLPAPAGAS